MRIKNKAAVIGFFCYAALFVLFSLFGEAGFKKVYALAGQTFTVTGVIVEKTEYSGDTAQYVVKADINGVKTKIRFFAEDILAEYGDTVTFEAKLRRLSDNTVFPERSYNFSKGIFLGAEAVSFSETETFETSEKTPIYYIREYNRYIKSKIMTAFPNDTGGLLCAVFLGDKSRLSDGLAENIKIAGVSHFAAVSGLHKYTPALSVPLRA
jgi:predicted membrane metal-binding protein